MHERWPTGNANHFDGSKLISLFQFRQREAIRLCLKHFRQHNYTDAFEFLQQKTRIQLEDPLLTELHRTIVRQGNYEHSEQIVTKAIEGKDILFKVS